TAIRLAVMASVRHRFTNYDERLPGGYDRYEARAMVRLEVDALLENLEHGTVFRRNGAARGVRWLTNSAFRSMTGSRARSRAWKFGANAGERSSAASLQRQDCPSAIWSATLS